MGLEKQDKVLVFDLCCFSMMLVRIDKTRAKSSLITIQEETTKVRAAPRTCIHK